MVKQIDNGVVVECDVCGGGMDEDGQHTRRTRPCSQQKETRASSSTTTNGGGSATTLSAPNASAASAVAKSP